MTLASERESGGERRPAQPQRELRVRVVSGRPVAPLRTMQHRRPIRAGLFVSFAPFLLSLLAGTACTKVQPDAKAEARSSTTPHSAEVDKKPKRTGAIEHVDVPNDRKVLVVVGEGKRPIVHLHGMCSEPRSDLEAWASNVSEHGTVIGLEADAACPNGSGRTWTTDAQAIDARVTEAIAAVNQARGLSLDPEELVVIGESMGAARATALASRFPERYTRLVLVGSPETPSAKDLGSAKAVALLAGEKEPQEKMRQGTTGLENAGLKARFWELAGATHGNYGPNGARSMTEAVAFVIGR